MNLIEKKPIVFTAQSKKNFFMRMLVCKYVFEHGGVPLNPFNVFGYFLYELVDRDFVRNGNNNLIARSDEVWFFGEIADGCISEIEYAIELGKKIAFYKMGSTYQSIEKCAIDELIFEDEVTVDTEKLKQKIKEYPYISLL